LHNVYKGYARDLTMLPELIIGGMLLCAAWYDWVYEKIPALMSALFWIAISVGVVTYDPLPLGVPTLSALIFGCIMLINEIAVKRKGIEFIGWGDVLILPIVISIIIVSINGMYGQVLAGLLAVGSLAICRHYKKNAFLPVFVLPYFSTFIKLG
jgi:hypothetical protein